VVNWTTVRLLLVLSQVLNLSTKQVDYTAAFIHPPINNIVYVEMPRGFSEPGKVLQLRKSLYGLEQSLRIFFKHLKSNLENFDKKLYSVTIFRIRIGKNVFSQNSTRTHFSTGHPVEFCRAPTTSNRHSFRAVLPTFPFYARKFVVDKQKQKQEELRTSNAATRPSWSQG
jgi:hypothetical protein